eukprot:Polyplicarium_translucidae@DN1773_c0_g1_i1.p2
MEARKAYLLGHSVISVLAWAVVGLKLVEAARARDFAGWDRLKVAATFAQSLALAEVLQSALGIVESRVFTAICQVASRMMLVVCWWVVPESTTHWALWTCLAAWTLAELIRYPFYGMKIFGRSLPILKWARYNAFMVLYPIGIASELRCYVAGLPGIAANPRLRAFPFRMPNRLNFEADLYVLMWVVFALYGPISVVLYRHMLRQRSKALRPKKE